MNNPTLFLIPNFLGTAEIESVFPKNNLTFINGIKHFVVENEKTARRFLHTLFPDKNINELEFYELNKKSTHEDWFYLVELLNSKESIGLLSEAGLPAIADPGAELVNLAHQKEYIVKPMVGPSSIFMALMASGFNGQKFSFHGYIPIDNKEKSRFLRTIEKQSLKDNSSQIFMETPYRNQQLFNLILKECKHQTQLCIAANITTATEKIQTKTIEQWQKSSIELHKIPAIFLLQA